jgi:hypothetical protein
MTRSMIRDRAARAVMETDPDAARRRREDAAKDARVETRPEEPGTAMIAGRDVPALSVRRISLALTSRARQLKKLGADGTVDWLRAQAFLEQFGEADPEADLRENGTGGTGSGNGGRGPRPGGGTGGTGNGGGCACGGTGNGTAGSRSGTPGPGTGR